MDEALPDELSAETIDAITEAVVQPVDAQARARVIVDVVHEMHAALKWRHDQQPETEEERSMARLVAAAAEHQRHMSN